MKDTARVSFQALLSRTILTVSVFYFLCLVLLTSEPDQFQSKKAMYINEHTRSLNVEAKSMTEAQHQNVLI